MSLVIKFPFAQLVSSLLLAAAFVSCDAHRTYGSSYGGGGHGGGGYKKVVHKSYGGGGHGGGHKSSGGGYKKSGGRRVYGK